MQEFYKAQGTSKADWGESAHNYNMAIDLFRLHLSQAEYDRPWFDRVVGPAIKEWNQDGSHVVALKWYGMPNISFPEAPHVEVWGWRAMYKSLVEDTNAKKTTRPPRQKKKTRKV